MFEPSSGVRFCGRRVAGGWSLVGWSLIVSLALGGCASSAGAATTASAATRDIAAAQAIVAKSSSVGTTPPTSQTVPPAAAVTSSATSSAKSPTTSRAASAGKSRSAAHQLVVAWWVSMIKLRLHRVADQPCVGGVVAKLGEADLALLVSAARSNSPTTPHLSAAGDALGPELSHCVAIGGRAGGQPTSSSETGPTTDSPMPGTSDGCWLSATEISSIFDMSVEPPTQRLHVGTFGRANGCYYQVEGITNHWITLLVYDKVDPHQVRSADSPERQYKPIKNLGDAAFYSGNSLDILMGNRLLTVDQEPYGNEDAIFASARLLLTRLK